MNSLTLPIGVSEAIFYPAPGEWVQLRNPLSDYSDREALLQCEDQDGQWLAWVPCYGLCRLDRSQFVSRS